MPKPVVDRLFPLLAIALLAMGVGLRLWRLDAIPSPHGDETNWCLMAWKLERGEPASLASGAQFVTRAFGKLIAGSFQLFGPSFRAARLVPAIGMMLGAAFVLALCRSRRTGLVVAALMSIHPWSLMWSRTCHVPYALSLALGIVGPLCWLRSLELPPGGRRTLALIGSGQVLAAGMHFSPLGCLPLLTCAAWMLTSPSRRSMLRTAGPWLSLAAVLWHVSPIAFAAGSIARSLPTEAIHEGWGVRTERYFLVVLDLLGGETTVRYFTNVFAEGTALVALRALTFAALATACIVVWKSARRAPESGGEATVPNELATFATLYFGISLVGMAVVLSFGRDWSFPYVDQERYGFAVLAPCLLLVGALAGQGSRRHWTVGVVACLLLLASSGRVLWFLARQGGPDFGWTQAAGGGTRAWRPANGTTALAEELWRIAEREARDEPVTLVASDWYSLQPIEFFAAVRGHTEHGPVRTMRFVEDVESGRNLWPNVPPGRRMIVATWPDSVYAKTYAPVEWRTFNADVRESFRRDFDDVRLLETILQANGDPLLEVWSGRVPEESSTDPR